MVDYLNKINYNNKTFKKELSILTLILLSIGTELYNSAVYNTADITALNYHSCSFFFHLTLASTVHCIYPCVKMCSISRMVMVVIHSSSSSGGSRVVVCYIIILVVRCNF